jgi:hypothetical protein
MKVVATAAAFIVLPGIFGLSAQDNRSLTDFESVRRGQEISVPAPEETDHGSLEEKLVLARSSIKALTESLAMANNEAEVFKRQSAELQLKLDAYGLAGLDKEPEKVEQRLLAAVRDLRLLKKQNEDAVTQLVRLSESIQVLIKTTSGVDPQARMGVETELRKTSEILGTPNVAQVGSIEATLSDGMVIDTKDDLSLVVANIGEKHGVKVGMPFQIWRDNRRIGEVRVVDVRDRICGAVIQNLESEKETVKTGDRLRVDAKQ